MKLPIMRTLLFTLVLLFAASSQADTLSDLRARLQAARPTTSFNAHIEVRSTNVTDDDGAIDKIERGIAVDATHDANGIRINWASSLLEKGRQQKAKSLRDPDAPKIGVSAPFDATAALDLLDAAPELLLVLEGATLVETRADKIENKPATLLALKLPISMATKEKKRLKKFDYTAKLWVDAEGWPVAMESHQYIKSSWMLMSFVTDTKEKRVYDRAAGRMFAALASRDVVFEGFGGMRNQEQATTTVTAFAQSGYQTSCR